MTPRARFSSAQLDRPVRHIGLAPHPMPVVANTRSHEESIRPRLMTHFSTQELSMPVSAIPSTPADQVERAATLTNVLYEKKGHIGYVTLNRPKVLNALSQGAWEDLRTAFEQARDDAAVLGLILTGAGDKAFIAGQDISELARATAVDAEKASR